jgi:hypothetical protein
VRIKRGWMAGGIGLSSLFAFALPAAATQSSPVTVTVSTTGPSATGRQLLLYDTSGQTLNSLDLSTGTKAFVAKVVDNSYSLTGYTVQASMSNLYGYANGQYSCAQTIPSSAVSVSTPPALLDVSGLASGLTPYYVLNGDLSTVLATLGLSNAVVTNAPVTGVAQALTQAQITGSSATDVIGSAVSTLAPNLPIQVSANVGGPFTTPAADPGGANCGVSGTNATSQPIMTGLANQNGLVGDLQTALGKLANDEASTLISNGYLDSTSVMTAVATALNEPPTLLAPFTTAIENTLTATLATTPLDSPLTSESGSYAATPEMTINTSGIPSGNYRGLLTVTEVDG